VEEDCVKNKTDAARKCAASFFGLHKGKKKSPTVEAFFRGREDYMRFFFVAFFLLAGFFALALAFFLFTAIEDWGNKYL
jgi:hypothetical protein